MSIEDLTKRFFAYWWIVLITGAAIALILFPWSSDTQYVGTVTVGINFNDPSFAQVDSSSQAYVNSFEQLSLYLTQRFYSIDIQKIISQESGLNISTLTNGKPFYDVENQGSGFANLSYSSVSKEQAESFNRGVIKAYQQIILEWNEGRQPIFKITPMQNVVVSVVQVQKPIQFQLLPVMSGILLGIVLILVLPVPNKKTKNLDDKSPKPTAKPKPVI